MQTLFDIDRDADAAYIRISEENIVRSLEVLDGLLVIDYDQSNAIAGIEIVSISGLKAYREKSGSLPKDFTLPSSFAGNLQLQFDILNSILPLYRSSKPV